MEQQRKEKKEELTNKNRTDPNKNISIGMDETDNKSGSIASETEHPKGVFGSLSEKLESKASFSSSDEQLMFNGKPVIKSSKII